MNKEEKKAYDKARYEANKETVNARTKAWSEANKEKHKALCRVWYETNKEYQLASAKTRYKANKTERKAHYETHKEKYKSVHKIWAQANREKCRARGARYRAKKAGVVTFPIRPNFLDYLKEVWDNKCAYCRKSSDIWHKDHFMPLSLNGHEAEYNYILACPSCNSRKSGQHPFLFIKEHKIDFIFKPYMKFPY